MNFQKIELKNTTQIRVRYADTDKMGFVYNGVYLTFFEVGRTELMRAFCLPYIEFEQKGYFLPLIESNVKYISPAHYDDLLDIETTYITEYKPIIKFDYRILLGNDIISNGYTIHTFINSQTHKPVKPPSFFWNKLNETYQKK